MEILKCTENELESVASFYDKVTKYLENNINYPHWTHGVYPGRKSAKAAIAEGSQYMCRDSGKAVGAFVLNCDPQGDYGAGDWTRALKAGEYMVIHSLAADPTVLRRGIGRRMTKYCISKAKNAGCKAIRLDVVPDNFPARSLYESLGFMFAGEKDLKRYIDGIPLFALYELNF